MNKVVATKVYKGAESRLSAIRSQETAATVQEAAEVIKKVFAKHRFTTWIKKIKTQKPSDDSDSGGLICKGKTAVGPIELVIGLTEDPKPKVYFDFLDSTGVDMNNISMPYISIDWTQLGKKDAKGTARAAEELGKWLDKTTYATKDVQGFLESFAGVLEDLTKLSRGE